ncbi:MAG TPA: helix-turn-helix domain-containing protein [Oligoflexia bacterium]|nr:helix-turn-helix domain-containing protein [Oligoflexia bacterium]HMR24285.1 helix-turn-helix domain-containing protein [Oligoflexia bacterium]
MTQSNLNESKIYKALGDPARLKMIHRLSNGSAKTIGELSKNLNMTRQGARKQLQVLVQSNLVKLNKSGRETHVVINIKTLEKARTFIYNIEKQWDARLNALKNFVEAEF